VSLLISEAYSDSVQEKLWPELLKSASFAQALKGFIIPVMGACFARSALRQKHSMYLSTRFPASSLYCSLTQTNVGFRSDDIFESVHLASCHVAFEDAQKFELETHHCLHRLKHQMQESMNQYKNASDEPNKAHLRELQRHSSYWKDVFSRIACFACLKNPCQIFLLCRHALCELCYQNKDSPLGSQSQLSYCDPISCTACPFCRVT